MTFESFQYAVGEYYDELIGPDGAARDHASQLMAYFDSMEPRELVERQQAVNSTITDMGISFTVYSDSDNIDRAWPLDIIPRAMPGAEWDRIERGLSQRLRALNLFIDDLYNDRRILKDGIVPVDVIDSSRS